MLSLGLLWLAAHAALLALLLGAKFLLTKTAVIAIALMAALVFVATWMRKTPRKLSHSPVV